MAEGVRVGYVVSQGKVVSARRCETLQVFGDESAVVRRRLVRLYPNVVVTFVCILMKFLTTISFIRTSTI